MHHIPDVRTIRGRLLGEDIKVVPFAIRRFLHFVQSPAVRYIRRLRRRCIERAGAGEQLATLRRTAFAKPVPPAVLEPPRKACPCAVNNIHMPEGHIHGRPFVPFSFFF